MKTSGYSIWLIPPGKLLIDLSNLITQLSKKYNCPNFTPHLTLLGGILGQQDEVVEKTDLLFSKIKSFDIKLLPNIGYEDIWTKALFIEAEETSQLMTANKKAGAVFNLNTGGYKPHVSLMYTEDIPIKERIRVSKQINLKQTIDQFEVDSLYLYETLGFVKDWRLVKEFRLKS